MNPTPTPVRRPTVGIFILIVVIGILWRLPYSATYPLSPGDETQYSITTIEHLEAGEYLSFMYGSDYGAPIHEWFAVVFRKVLGPSLLALRLPLVLFGSFAAGIFFLSLRTAIPIGAACALALLVACPPSSAAFYTAFSQPAYAATLFFIALIQIATFWVDRSRTIWRWAVLGLLMGAAIYIFKLSVLQSGVSLLWLLARSAPGRELLAEITTIPAIRQRARRAALFGGAAILTIAPVAYRALTRRGNYHISKPELALVLLAVLLASAAAILAIRLVRIRAASLLPCAACATAFAIFAFFPALHFAYVEKPRLIASGTQFYGEIAYSLKHFHEWPFQAKLFAERVFPALIFGRMSELEPYPVNGVRCGWPTAFTFLFFTALAIAGFRRWKGRASPRIFESTDLVIILPFFLVIAIMAPSWSLHGDFCYRYLLLFYPGLLLFAFRCFQPVLQRHNKASLALLAAYLLYAAYDCRVQIPATLEKSLTPAAYFPTVSAKKLRIAFQDS